jgi:hypothetical protein
MIRKGKSPAARLLKARILLKAEASEAGEGWSDKRIVEALETSLSMVVPPRIYIRNLRRGRHLRAAAAVAGLQLSREVSRLSFFGLTDWVDELIYVLWWWSGGDSNRGAFGDAFGEFAAIPERVRAHAFCWDPAPRPNANCLRKRLERRPKRDFTPI